MSDAKKSGDAPAARIAVALVDDDPHFVLFLETVFGASARHRVAATANSAAAALKWPTAAAPHVALVDVAMPGRGGAELVTDLLKKFPQLLVIMLTAKSDDDPLLASIRAGAVGYLLKGVDETEIIAAIDDALAGGAPMSPSIARKVLAAMRGAPAAKPDAKELIELTPRETEVLELVASGESNKSVATRLGLSNSTVKNCLLGIYAKWRVNSRTEAAVKYRSLQ